MKVYQIHPKNAGRRLIHHLKYRGIDIHQGLKSVSEHLSPIRLGCLSYSNIFAACVNKHGHFEPRY